MDSMDFSVSRGMGNRTTNFSLAQLGRLVVPINTQLFSVLDLKRPECTPSLFTRGRERFLAAFCESFR